MCVCKCVWCEWAKERASQVEILMPISASYNKCQRWHTKKLNNYFYENFFFRCRSPEEMLQSVFDMYEAYRGWFVCVSVCWNPYVTQRIKLLLRVSSYFIFIIVVIVIITMFFFHTCFSPKQIYQHPKYFLTGTTSTWYYYICVHFLKKTLPFSWPVKYQ